MAKDELNVRVVVPDAFIWVGLDLILGFVFKGYMGQGVSIGPGSSDPTRPGPLVNGPSTVNGPARYSQGLCWAKVCGKRHWHSPAREQDTAQGPAKPRTGLARNDKSCRASGLLLVVQHRLPIQLNKKKIQVRQLKHIQLNNEKVDVNF